MLLKKPGAGQPLNARVLIGQSVIVVYCARKLKKKSVVF